MRPGTPRLASTPGRARRVLGIDPGTTCGWAVLDANARGEVRVVDSGVVRLPRGAHPGERFEAALRALGQLVDRHQPLAVSVEHVARVQRSVAAAAVYHGLRAMLAYLCLTRGLALLEVGVSTVKKRATGRGNADKHAMVDAARLALGREPATHDEADALFVALCGVDEAARWEAA